MAMIGLCSCGNDGGGQSLHGTVTVSYGGWDPAPPDGPCVSAVGGSAIPDGYSDVHAGASVTIRNGSNNIAGVGTLGEGKSVSLAQWHSEGNSSNGCRFEFTASVADSPYYVVSVGNRGAVTFQKGEAMDLTLGDAGGS